MNLDAFLAKSNPAISIAEHNHDLLRQFEKLIPFLPKQKVYQYKDFIKKLLEFHDLGKVNDKFQNKLKTRKQDSKEIPHEWLSIAFVDETTKKWLKGFDTQNVKFYTLFCYCIANHHTRSYSFSKKEIENIIKNEFSKKFPDICFNYDYDIQKDFNNKIENNFENYFEHLVFFKGILHKCDYAASARIDCEVRYHGNYEYDFKKGLSKKGISNLKPFQANAKNLANNSVILIASTGMGKTEYAMNWINGDKAFYLLGLKIAVNAMYDRFVVFFNKNNVVLLHGDTNYNLANEVDSIDDYDYKIAKAKQLSYPITIATADQLITSVFKFNGFELYYLVASYSKIVVDEIQSFAPESIACIVVFLQEIAKLGGKFLIITATLPPFIKDEFKNIAHFEEPQLSDIKRHKIEVIDEFVENFNFSSIESTKLLIICNTVNKAQSVYEKLKDKNPKLLHSRFITKDRKAKEQEIMECKSGIWITTQIVEASLDIDFDVLLTECSSIDSILQRLGRCYRKREYNKDEPNILIFKFDENSKKIYDAEILEKSFDVLSCYSGKLLTEAQKQEMIDKVFENIENTKYYKAYKDYKELLKSGFRAEKKSEAQELFRKISNTHMVIPKPIYDSYKDEIDNLIKNIDQIAGLERIKLKNELQQYCVSLQIFDNQKLKLLQDLPIESEFLKKSNIKLLDGVKYSYEKGIEFDESYKNMDNIIF